MRKENGRSMIEMLGVLAIIGVISIGGISLYRRAVDTNKANNIFDDVNRFEFVISERIDSLPHGEINVGDFNAISGFTMTAYNEPAEQRHYIMVSDVPENVCRILLEKGGEKYTMYAYNRLYEGDTNICDNDGEVVTFYFGETGELCTAVPDVDEGEVACSNGCRCADGNVCKEDRYNPTNPRLPQLGSNHTVCCEDKNTVIACHNGCADTSCPAHMTFDYEKCECVCQYPETMIYDAEQKDCICGMDKNDVQLVLRDGKCVCPTAGYTLADGACTKVECKPSGDSYRCYINDKQCGYTCTSTGEDCSVGACRASDCPEGTTWKMISGFSNAFCVDKNDFKCFQLKYSSPISYRCTNGTKECCNANYDSESNTFVCRSGVCEDPTCPNGGTYGPSSTTYIWGCQYAGNVRCRKENSVWKCYRNGTLCGTCDSKDVMPNCGTCSQASCPNGASPSDTDGTLCSTITDATARATCENKGYCKKDDILCNENNKYCYKIVSTDLGSTFSQCGYSCYHYGSVFGRCEYGSCVASDNNCSGGSFGQLTVSKIWGCKTTIDENTRMECYYGGKTNTASCYVYVGSKVAHCGGGCNSDGTNCTSWSHEMCAPASAIDPQKKECVLNAAVTETCACPTVPGADGVYRDYEEGDTPLAVGQLCCAIGSSNVNNGCSVVNL